MTLLSATGVAIENFLGISGFDIYWYGICIAVGFGLAFAVCCIENKFMHYNNDLPTDILILAVIGAIVGARSYYVAFEWKLYYVPGNFAETLKNIFDLRSGGLAIYGGIIGAIIAISIYAYVKKIRLTNLLDLAAAPLALGQAIGRWGNFFNQEAHGSIVLNEKLQFFPYAVYCENPKNGDVPGWYQATFFYESLWCLIIFGILLLVFFKLRKYSGQVALSYFALYGLERGIVEWLRTDQLRIFSVPVSAILSILLCITSVILLILAHKKGYNVSPYMDEAVSEENK